MLRSRKIGESVDRRELPADIYIPLVDSLYDDTRSLFVGSLATVAAVLLSAWKTGEPLLVFCAGAMMMVAIARLLAMSAYWRPKNRPKSVAAARKWEIEYVIGAAVYVSLLGLWCVIAFGRSSDGFVRQLSLVVTIAHLIGVSGRNFGSERLVAVLILCASLPITLALMLAQDVYHLLLAVILVPFFLALKFISDRLRKTLLDAVTAARDVTFLARRFDAALNNMPHGLCMFDAGGRLDVANTRLAQILGLDPQALERGLTVEQLIGRCIDAGVILPTSADNVRLEIERRLAQKSEGKLVVEIQDGRTLDFTFQRMDNGGSVVLVEDVTERRTAEAKINHLARYDTLTGLPNRTFFRAQMDRILAGRRRIDEFALLFIDLDEFKQVNDTLGHPCGDALLCAVAQRLQALIRSSDFVGRFGGDEFVVLQVPITRPEEAASLARRIVNSLSEPFDIEGHHIVVGASVGIAVAPDDGADADLLFRNADMALYRAKSEGRSGWRFFEAEMNVKTQARRSLELDLRNALANDHFEVHYQPILNLKRRRISSCEALVRWRHPERGMVSPAEFIPVAEEMGLIVAIGNCVLRKACMECARWPDNVRVAVNLSPLQFKRGNLVTAIREALAESGLAPSRLEIEITESVLLQDTESTHVVLKQLRELGVRISLDDFGTGYSSLSYLHSFPLHKVKIDRSFLQDIVSNERSRTLLRGVAQLSAELGMSVVVEGIETEEQLALVLAEPSISEAQGYLFSRPVSGRDVRTLLYATASPMDKVA
ncbi:MAG TPA: EAL domain-containing protein [Xanthobacteraceae bacterium]|nr:EAL domain-containing protein [Xanthobacteraceae bacterium]